MVRSFWKLPHWIWNHYACGKSCTWCYRFICCDGKETGQVFWISRCLSLFPTYIEHDDQGKDSTEKSIRQNAEWAVIECLTTLLFFPSTKTSLTVRCTHSVGCLAHAVPFRLIRLKIKSKRSPNNAIAALAYNISNGRQAEYCTLAKKTRQSEEKIK